MTDLYFHALALVHLLVNNEAFSILNKNLNVLQSFAEPTLSVFAFVLYSALQLCGMHD